MLEQKLTTLDLKYIKLYSEFMIDRNPNTINDRLKDLALKGQLNAIQTWYAYNKIGDCPEIDKIVESLKEYTYDELFAKGRYLMSIQKENADNLISQYNATNEAINDAHKNDFYGRFYCRVADTSKEEIELKQIEDSLLKIEFIRYFRRAADLAHSIADQQQNPYLLQKASDLYRLATKYPPFYDQSYAEMLNESCLKILRRMYKTEMKGTTPKNNPQFFYHFARAILLSKGNDKLRHSAINMLKEISDYNTTLEK